MATVRIMARKLEARLTHTRSGRKDILQPNAEGRQATVVLDIRPVRKPGDLDDGATLSSRL